MRIPHRRTDGSGAAPGGAIVPRRQYGGTSHGRVLAHGSVHDPRSEQPRRRRRSRLPPASWHRLVAASDGRRSAARIRSDLVAARQPDDRGFVRTAFDERPGLPRDLEVLTKLAPPALYTDVNLLALVICRAVNLSLERGHCDASCIAYVSTWHDRRRALRRLSDRLYRFGQLGYDLVEQTRTDAFPGQDLYALCNGVLPWTRHVRAGRDLLRRAFEAANTIGDLTYAAYCGNELTTNLLTAGDPLAEVEHEAEHGLAFARGRGSGLSLTASPPSSG